jgi:uncharacterized membrane protein YciS (DUF1049 family)
LLDGAVRDPKLQLFRQLRHGQLQIDSLFAKVFTKGFWVGWILP